MASAPYDGLVTTGPMFDLALLLSRKINRRVHINRNSYKYRNAAGKFKLETRYSIAIEGCHVLFHGLTVNEVKGRISMVLDMISGGVLNANSSGSQPGTDCGGHPPEGDAGGEHGRTSGEEPRPQGGVPVFDQPSGDDDFY